MQLCGEYYAYTENFIALRLIVSYIFIIFTLSLIAVVNKE